MQTKVKRNVPVKLTDEELKICSKMLAEALQSRSQAEAKLDTFKAQVKAEVMGCDAIIGKMAHMVNTEEEYREVDCDVVYHWDTGFKTVVRKDTGEIVEDRILISAEERQAELEFQEEQQKSAGAPVEETPTETTPTEVESAPQ